MIDQLYVRAATRKTLPEFTEYTPDLAVEVEHYHQVDSAELAVIVPPWHRSPRAQSMLTKRLAGFGVDTLDYGLHPGLLQADSQKVIDSVMAASDHIAHRIEELRDQRGYERVHLICMSLGSTTMCNVAARLESFDTATFVATGHDLASGLWNGSRTQQIRQGFEEKGIDQDQLSEAWHDLHPRTHTDVFQDKKVTVIRSTKDNIVPSADQEALDLELRNAGARVTTHLSRLGHLATPGRFCVAGPIDEVLKT